MIHSNLNTTSHSIPASRLGPEFDSARTLVTTAHNVLASEAIQATVEFKNTTARNYEIQTSVHAKYQDAAQKAQLKTILNNSAFSHRLVGLNELDVDALLGAEYLKDEAINEFFKTIEFQHHDIVARTSFELYADEHDTLKNSSFFEKILKKDNMIKAGGRETIEKLKSAKLILLPINAGLHWYLMAIHKNEANQYHLFCLDSLNAFENHPRFFERISTFLTALNPECTVASRNSVTIPVQTRGTLGGDCGAAICYFASHIAQDTSWLYALPNYQHSTCNYAQYRTHIAHVLANHVAQDAQAQMQAQLHSRQTRVPTSPITPITPNNTRQRNFPKILSIARGIAVAALGVSVLFAITFKTAVFFGLFAFLSACVIGIALKLQREDELRLQTLDSTPAPTQPINDNEVEIIMEISPSLIVPKATQKKSEVIDLTQSDSKKSTPELKP